MTKKLVRKCFMFENKFSICKLCIVILYMGSCIIAVQSNFEFLHYIFVQVLAACTDNSPASERISSEKRKSSNPPKSQNLLQNNSDDNEEPTIKKAKISVLSEKKEKITKSRMSFGESNEKENKITNGEDKNTNDTGELFFIDKGRNKTVYVSTVEIGTSGDIGNNIESADRVEVFYIDVGKEVNKTCADEGAIDIDSDEEVHAGNDVIDIDSDFGEESGDDLTDDDSHTKSDKAGGSGKVESRKSHKVDVVMVTDSDPDEDLDIIQVPDITVHKKSKIDSVSSIEEVSTDGMSPVVTDVNVDLKSAINFTRGSLKESFIPSLNSKTKESRGSLRKRSPKKKSVGGDLKEGSSNQDKDATKELSSVANENVLLSKAVVHNAGAILKSEIGIFDSRENAEKSSVDSPKKKEGKSSMLKMEFTKIKTRSKSENVTEHQNDLEVIDESPNVQSTDVANASQENSSFHESPKKRKIKLQGDADHDNKKASAKSRRQNRRISETELLLAEGMSTMTPSKTAGYSLRTRRESGSFHADSKLTEASHNEMLSNSKSYSSANKRDKKSTASTSGALKAANKKRETLHKRVVSSLTVKGNDSDIEVIDTSSTDDSERSKQKPPELVDGGTKTEDNIVLGDGVDQMDSPRKRKIKEARVNW